MAKTKGRRARLDEAATVGRVIHDFLWHYAPTYVTRSENTLRGYRLALRLYLEYLASVGVTPETLCADDLCRKRIEGYLEWLETERGNEPQTRALRLSAIRRLCRYAAGHEASLAHVAAEAAAVEKPTAPRTKVRAITKEAVAALMSAPDLGTRQGRKDAALIATTYATAGRVSEVLGIRVRDLHLDAEKPYAEVTGKGGGGRVVYIEARAARHLRRHVAETLGERPSPDAYVFWSREHGRPGERPLSPAAVTKTLQKYAKVAHGSCPDLPERLTPHILRHARASHWLDEGMGLAQISLLLGHKSVETTMRYLDISMSKLAEAMSRVPGLPEAPEEPLYKSDKAASLLETCGFTL